jgi:hypothetical protein
MWNYIAKWEKTFLWQAAQAPASTKSLSAGGWYKHLPAQIPLCCRAGTRQHKESFLLAQSCWRVLRPSVKTGFS